MPTMIGPRSPPVIGAKVEVRVDLHLNPRVDQATALPNSGLGQCSGMTPEHAAKVVIAFYGYSRVRSM
jgi:hypothetical protein